MQDLNFDVAVIDESFYDLSRGEEGFNAEPVPENNIIELKAGEALEVVVACTKTRGLNGYSWHGDFLQQTKTDITIDCSKCECKDNCNVLSSFR